MRFPLFTIIIAMILFAPSANAQKRSRHAPQRPLRALPVKPSEVGTSAVVMDETLSVLRAKPSLYADPIQRMRRGRKLQVLGVAEADDVRFYKVAVPPANFGWVQAEAVFNTSRVGDEERLAKLVQAADGFDQIELAVNFLEMYPVSKLRPSILLLLGDLLEEVAIKLSRDATSRLSRREMAASAAPIHSYYLNFVSLDRYRKLGIRFTFNTATRSFHYDGASWQELVSKYSAAPEAAEARKRLEGLKVKMEKPEAK